MVSVIGSRHPASASCLGRYLRLAGRCPNNSSLFLPHELLLLRKHRFSRFSFSPWRTLSVISLCSMPAPPKGELFGVCRSALMKLPPSGELANAVSLRGFTKDQQTFPSQRDRFRRKQALQMPFSATTPTCEKAILENPQIFQNCEIKINFPLNMPRVQQRRPPPVAETGRSCWGSGQQDARAAQGTMRVLGAATR